MAGGIMAALDGTQEPFTPGPPKPDELTEMVQLGVKAWNKEIEDLERSWRVDAYIREFHNAHGPELERLRKPLSKEVLKRYSKAFADFQRWARNDGVDGFPIHACVAAAYLSVLMLAEKPLREIREAAKAIEHYHRISEHFFDSDYIAITLKKAAQYAALKQGDKSKANGHDNAHPEKETDNGS